MKRVHSNRGPSRIAPAPSKCRAVRCGTSKGVVLDECTGKSLPPRETCRVVAAHAPDAGAGPGSQSASLEVSATPGGPTSAALTGTALRPAKLELASSAVDFGEGWKDVPVVKSLEVKNTGEAASGPVQIDIACAACSDGEIQATAPASGGCSDSGSGPPAGGSCAVDLRWTPKARGARAATLTVRAVPGGSSGASLTGVGIAHAGPSFWTSQNNQAAHWATNRRTRAPRARTSRDSPWSRWSRCARHRPRPIPAERDIGRHGARGTGLP